MKAAVCAAVAGVLALGVAVASAAIGSLSLVETETNGVGGVLLPAPVDIDVSSDGLNLYATIHGSGTNGIAVFSRDPVTGELEFLEAETDVNGTDALAGAGDIRVSPDGDFVYATAGNATIASFARASDGSLSVYEVLSGVAGLSDADGVGVSPDSTTVYAAGSSANSIVAFERNISDNLDQIDIETDGAGGVSGLTDVNDILVSPDGENVYTTASGTSAVVTFDRAGDGTLSFNEVDTDDGSTSFGGPVGLAASADNQNVYVAGAFDWAVTTFSRAADGKLTAIDAEIDGVAGVEGLDAAWDVGVTPDGESVYAIGLDSDQVSTFARDAGTGALSYVESDPMGNEPNGIVTSPDNMHVYTTAFQAGTLEAWARAIQAPSNVEPPALSGPPGVGGTLICALGTWDGIPAPALSVEWLRGGVPIPGEEGSSYTSTAADRGQSITCRVTATNDAGSASATSNAIVVDDPDPVYKQLVGADPVSGTVTYSCPGGQQVNLTQTILLPINCVIDATKGRVSLTTADPSGAQQTADFYGGVFKVGQVVERESGLQVTITTVTLTGPLKCGKAKKGKGKGKKGAVASGPVALASARRGLWGSGRGRFRSGGKRSSATVRGTTWLTQDTCAGTLTKVVEGIVVVDDFGRKTDITLRAGQSYLARAKGKAKKKKQGK